MAIELQHPADAAPLPDTITPQQLAAAWKREGGFDALRRSLLAEFLASPSKEALLADLDTALPSLMSKPSFKGLPRKERHGELLQQLRQELSSMRDVEAEVEKRLREGGVSSAEAGEGGSGSIEKGLRRTLRGIRGEAAADSEEDEDEDEIVLATLIDRSANPMPAPPPADALSEPSLLAPATAPHPPTATDEDINAAQVPTTPEMEASLPSEAAEVSVDGGEAMDVDAAEAEPAGAGGSDA